MSADKDLWWESLVCRHSHVIVKAEPIKEVEVPLWKITGVFGPIDMSVPTNYTMVKGHPLSYFSKRFIIELYDAPVQAVSVVEELYEEIWRAQCTMAYCHKCGCTLVYRFAVLAMMKNKDYYPYCRRCMPTIEKGGSKFVGFSKEVL